MAPITRNTLAPVALRDRQETQAQAGPSSSVSTPAKDQYGDIWRSNPRLARLISSASEHPQLNDIDFSKRGPQLTRDQMKDAATRLMAAGWDPKDIQEALTFRSSYYDRLAALSFFMFKEDDDDEEEVVDRPRTNKRSLEEREAQWARFQKSRTETGTVQYLVINATYTGKSDQEFDNFTSETENCV